MSTAGELGSYTGRPQQFSAGGQFASQCHVPVAADGGPHIGQRRPASASTSAISRAAPSGSVSAQPPRQAGLHGDGGQRVAEQVVQVAGDPGASFSAASRASSTRASASARLPFMTLRRREHGEGDDRNAIGVTSSGRQSGVGRRVPHRDEERGRGSAPPRWGGRGPRDDRRRATTMYTHMTEPRPARTAPRPPTRRPSRPKGPVLPRRGAAVPALDTRRSQAQKTATRARPAP